MEEKKSDYEPQTLRIENVKKKLHVDTFIVSR